LPVRNQCESYISVNLGRTGALMQLEKNMFKVQRVKLRIYMIPIKNLLILLENTSRRFYRWYGDCDNIAAVDVYTIVY